MDSRATALLLIVAGLGIAALGVLLLHGGLGWFGRLPGDIRIETERTRLFIPVTSMLLVSIVLTLLANLLRRFLG